jgi:hypothetical protein
VIDESAQEFLQVEIERVYPGKKKKILQLLGAIRQRDLAVDGQF